MSTLSEFLPVIAFILVYILSKLLDFEEQAIYYATITLIFFIVIQLLYFLIRKIKIKNSFWFTSIIVILLGSITVIFKNPTFIYLKPSIINLIFAVILLLSKMFFNESLVKKGFNNIFEMPEYLWNRLHYSCIAFLLFCSAINYWVAFNFSEEFWVGFKLWGLTSATFVFIVSILFLFKNYLREDKTDVKNK